MDDFLLMALAMEDEEMEAKDELDELHFEDDEDDLCDDPDDFWDYIDLDLMEELWREETEGE